MLRLLMTTLGRGGEGQRVRDEVLNIMHRHHIKEVSGHFLEEWHQKLHNNTTPDDIVICRAYLEFLRSGGNLDRFYETLKAGGVTKERLESFDRPILSHPDFIADKKDALIHDFQEFLKILNSVHSATDLRSATEAARYLLDGETAGDLDFVLGRGDDPDVSPLELSGRLTGARQRLGGRLGQERDPGRVRDMLFLDISLEEFLRTVVERNTGNLGEDELVDSAALAAGNIALSHGGFEFDACRRHWERLRGMERFGRDWSLHAAAVLERMGRAVNGFIDLYQGLFQPKALYLGKAFGAEPWTVNLFTEELIRGRLVFVLSLLFRRLNPALRRHAGLGDWQVISLAHATGTVEVAPELGSVQSRSYERPTVIITDRVAGNEEPPDGVTAVITSGTVDLVSHVAIRARNAGMLFASCYDTERLEELKALAGKAVSLSVDAKGDVIVGEAGGEEGPGPRQRRLKREISRPAFRAYAIGAEDFREGLVGGKSLNVQRLRGKLPDWMMLPRSVAIPFGAFEKVLALEANRKTRQRSEELLGLVEGSPPEILSQLREAVMGLEAPEELFAELEGALGAAGLAMPPRQEAWRCIKAVWASKWNERAYLSRVTWGIPHEDLLMAVLVQEVVEAEYAFVIHTANPFTGADGELYAEVVLGLGEALVGNYPGRAMGFTAMKDRPEPRLLSYPSKSQALYGGGLIFRSDSNGEDLVGYAGAGLYESVMVSRPQRKPVDYTEERLVWDGRFRDELLSAIAEVGISVEAAMGSAQDIEGAYEGGRYHVLQTRPQVMGDR
jgi:alpha-glucan,water dikinase